MTEDIRETLGSLGFDDSDKAIEKVMWYFKNRLDKTEILVSAINKLDLEPQNSLDKNLWQVGLRRLQCKDCEHYYSEEGRCGYYDERVFGASDDARDCSHFAPVEDIWQPEYADCGTDELRFVQCDDNAELPDIHTVLDIIRKDKSLNAAVEALVYDNDEEENAEKWDWGYVRW